jgi:hypothetical protein
MYSSLSDRERMHLSSKEIVIFACITYVRKQIFTLTKEKLETGQRYSACHSKRLLFPR